MVKIYPRVAGKTLGCDEKLLERIKKRGVKVVESFEESDVTVVFCPIVSRFETDVNEALTSLLENEKAIVVAMHHTFDPNYVLPNHRLFENQKVILLVDILFFETQGLLKCPCNTNSKKKIYKKLEEHGKKKKKGKGQRSGTKDTPQVTPVQE